MKIILFFHISLAFIYSVFSNSLQGAVGNTQADSGKRVVCYYGSWATYRPGLGQFEPENIDPFICTHVLYSFAGLDNVTNTIYSLDPYNDLYDNGGKGAYERFTNLATINPDLKCLLSVGGWNEDPVTYSNMANDPAKRSTFVSSVTPFLEKYGFHGLDLDWEYPDERGGIVADKEAYSALLQELKESFAGKGYLLSVAVAAAKDTIDAAYNVPEIVQQVDFINLMTYDFHGDWEAYTGENAPLHSRPGETDEEQLLNVEYSVNYWIQLGAPATIINLGMPTYGHSYTLADEYSVNYWIQLGAPATIINLGMPTYGHSYTLADVTLTDFYSPSTGAGDAGPYTREGGTLGYNEICVYLQDGGWTVNFDQDYQAPYMFKDNQWVGYDDTESIAAKSQFVNDLNLGGAMIWSIETDDFQATCSSQAFPLLSVINEYLRPVAR